jgi:pyrophosphatase PpaX
MSKINGILFDFDGVLSSIIVRLGWPYYQTFKKVKPNAKRKDVERSLEEMVKMMGSSDRLGFFYLPRLFTKIGRLLNLNYLELFRFVIILLILLHKNKTNIAPSEKAEEVLAYTTSRFKTGLVTHAERKVIVKAKKLFPSLENFDIILTRQDFKQSKPHPESLLKALRAMNLPPDKAIFVGDLPHDIIAGKKAGTKTIAVVNFEDAQESKRELLLKYNPDYIIDHVHELPSLLEKINSN